MSDPALTVSDVARSLDVSVNTVRRWAESGLIASTRTAGGHRRFRHEDVERRRRELGLAVKLRATPFPADPEPEFAAVVRDQGAAIARRAATSIYQAGHPGFFLHDRSASALAAWLGVVQLAAESASWQPVIDATRRLPQDAAAAGVATSPLEVQLFMEAFGAVLAASLPQSAGAREASRRAFVALRRAAIEGANSSSAVSAGLLAPARSARLALSTVSWLVTPILVALPDVEAAAIYELSSTGRLRTVASDGAGPVEPGELPLGEEITELTSDVQARVLTRPEWVGVLMPRAAPDRLLVLAPVRTSTAGTLGLLALLVRPGQPVDHAALRVCQQFGESLGQLTEHGPGTDPPEAAAGRLVGGFAAAWRDVRIAKL